MQTGHYSPDLTWFALSMSLGIISVSAHDNGLEVLSLAFLVIDVFSVLLLTGFFILKLLSSHNAPACDDRACRYGLFSAVAAAAILTLRLSYTGIDIPIFPYILLPLFLLGACLVSRPAFPIEIYNASGKVDTSLTIFPISMLSVAIAILHQGTVFQLFATLIGALSMIIFFAFQFRFLVSLISRGLNSVNRSGTLFINFGFPALSSIFLQLLSHLPDNGGIFHIYEFCFLLSLILWALATVLLPIIVAIYLTGPRTFRFETSKLSMVFPMAVYSGSTFLLSSSLGILMIAISLAMLFSSIAVLVVLVGEIASSRMHFSMKD